MNISILNSINMIVGLLSFISAASIIFTTLHDKEEKSRVFLMFVLLICTGNVISGLHRISHILGLMDSSGVVTKALNSVYPVNDILLIITGFLLSYMIYHFHFGDKQQKHE